MPSYVIFAAFPRAMHVMRGESQLPKIKAVSSPLHHTKKLIQICKTELKAQKVGGKFKRKQQPSSPRYAISILVSWVGD